MGKALLYIRWKAIEEPMTMYFVAKKPVVEEMKVKISKRKDNSFMKPWTEEIDKKKKKKKEREKEQADVTKPSGRW